MTNEVPKKAQVASIHPSEAERRVYPRYSFTATVYALALVTGLRIKGRTNDLSRGGCYVDTISPFAIGTFTKVRIYKGNTAYDVEARVIYSRTSVGMGLVFTKMAEHSMVLEQWMEEVVRDHAYQLHLAKTVRSGANS